MGKKPVDGGRFQHQAVRVGGVRRGVLVRGAAGVEQQLQRQRQLHIARQDGADRSQCAACAVAAHRQPRHVCAQRAALCGQPLQRVPGVGQFTAERVVRGNAANGEPAAMQVQQQRQAGIQAGRIQARCQCSAVACWNVKVFHARQVCLGHFQHA